MIIEIKRNKKLNDAGWDNSTIFVEETETTSEYFGCYFFLTVKTYQLKVKMSAINGAFLEFKRQCGIKEKIITNYRSEKDFTIAIYCLEKNISVDKEKK